ncbi:hypothetical protein [Chakrabartyella piscis]|uniref:hypothetical protein n=1 Tax=Chakrabartyella piscis TaxID=2918914 RepID=UPI002958C59F|nr:hypothetical protein [Chakrabartyella piscis]
MFEIVHIGIPTTQEKEGEVFVEGAGIYVTVPELSPFAMEYVRFLPNSIFPEEMHYDVHVAAKVDSIEKYVELSDSVIVPKMDNGDCYLCFVKKDGAIIELIEMK